MVNVTGVLRAAHLVVVDDGSAGIGDLQCPRGSNPAAVVGCPDRIGQATLVG